MENQHRKITGYRELSQEEIDLMNEIKAKGQELESLISRVRDFNNPAYAVGEDVDEALRESVQSSEANRWTAEARTDFQKACMSLTRAVAKPEFF